MSFPSHPRCPICEHPYELEVCIVDQLGRVVHKSCGNKAFSATGMSRSNYDDLEGLLQQAQELKEVANRLIERSDALIASYKQLKDQAKHLRMHH